MKTKLILAGLIALCALTGCTTTHVAMQGFTLERTAFLTKNNISEVTINKDGTASMKGYSNEQTEVAAAVAEAVAKALAPVPAK